MMKIYTWKNSVNPLTYYFPFFLLLFAFGPFDTKAQWSCSPTPNLAVFDTTSNAICNDGAGGVIILGGNKVQRVDSSGVARWGVNGVAFTTDTIASSKIAPDGSGGAVIVWEKKLGGVLNDIKAQRVNSMGTLLWTANGVTVSNDPVEKQSPFVIVAAGMSYFTWIDNTGSANNAWAHKFDALGNPLWTANGVRVCPSCPSYNIFSSVVPVDLNADSGIVVARYDFETSKFIAYVQRLDPTDGSLKWGAGGTLVCTDNTWQQNPIITNSSDGLYILAWADNRGPWDVYSQKIDRFGNRLWADAGIEVVNNTHLSGDKIQLSSDNTGGAIIIWDDQRSGNTDIYGQRIAKNGTLKWVVNGIPVTSAAGNQEFPSQAFQSTNIIEDGNGGAIVTWDDLADGNVYVNCIDSNGVTSAANGNLISNSKGGAIIATAKNGGGIIAFSSATDSTFIQNYSCFVNAAFSVLDTVCIGDSAAFINQCTPFESDLNFAWHFGDPASGTDSISVLRNPKHYFSSLGTYTVSLIATSPCGKTDTVLHSLIVDPCMPPVFAGFTTDTVCFGDSTAFADTTLGSPTSWSWDFGDPASGANASSDQNPKHLFTAGSTFTVTLTASNGGPPSMIQKAVIVKPLPVTEMNPNIDLDSMCMGGNYSLSAIAGFSTSPYTFSWSPVSSLNNSTLQSPTASPTVSTVYFITATDALGCSSKDSITIRVDPLPTVSLISDAVNDSSCLGGNINFTATSGYSTYTFFNNLSQEQTGAANMYSSTGLVNGNNVFVVAINDFSCRDTSDSLAIKIISPLNKPNIICDSTSVNFIRFGWDAITGSIGYEVSLDTGLTWLSQAGLTKSVTGLSIGDSLQLIARALGNTVCGNSINDTAVCYAADCSTVNFKLSSYNNTLCVGNSRTLSIDSLVSPSSAYDIRWNAGTPTQDTFYLYNAVSAGLGTLVSVSLRDSSQLSCPATTKNFTLNILNGPVVNAGLSKEICIGDNTILSPTVTGGSGIYAISWSPINDLSNPTSLSTIASPTTSISYTLSVTDNGLGCSAITDSLIITVNPLPIITTSQPADTMCAHNTALYTGFGGISYIWENLKNPGFIVGTNNTLSVLLYDHYTNYRVTGTDAKGCKNMDTVVMVVNPPTITLSNLQPICKGDSLDLTISGTSFYWWSPYSSPSTTISNTNFLNVKPDTTTRYIVSGSDGFCHRSDTFTVIVNVPIIPIVSSNKEEICQGESVLFNTAAGANNYTWIDTANSNVVGSTPILTISPPSTTGYKVKVTDTNNCISESRVILITVTPLPIELSAITDTLCEGESTTLTATGASSFVWSPSTGLNITFGATISASPSATTTYTVEATDGSCMVKKEVRITVLPSPIVAPMSDVSIISGNSTTLMASGGGTYNWAPSQGLSCSDCQSPVANPTVTSTYTVSVTNAEGCSAEELVTVYVDILCGNVFIPSAFSPNKDNYNDKLYVKGNCLKELTFIVYDRWGTEVFTTMDINQAWDGTFNGEPVNSGIYYFYLKAIKTSNNEPIDRKGEIAIIR